LLIKVVLSTASKERVILFDHLLKNKGQLDTINIKDHLLISKKTALKTMTELVILEIVNKQNMDSSNNNVFQIQLKEEFNWFLSDEFKKLREDFGKEYYDEYVKSKQEKQEQETKEEQEEDKDI
jgi:predicted ArsR family transcriptional regulator